MTWDADDVIGVIQIGESCHERAPASRLERAVRKLSEARMSKLQREMAKRDDPPSWERPSVRILLLSRACDAGDCAACKNPKCECECHK